MSYERFDSTPVEPDGTGTSKQARAYAMSQRGATALRVFRVKFLPTTNTKPSRYKISDLCFHKSLTLSKDGIDGVSFRDVSDEARFWLAYYLGITCDHVARDPQTRTTLLMSTNFEKQLQKPKGGAR